MNHIEIKKLKLLKVTWEKLDSFFIEDSLDEKVLYESHWVIIPLKGRTKVLKYLNVKFLNLRSAMRESLIIICPRIGFVKKNKRPCLLISQIILDKLIQVKIQIELKDDLISKIEICLIRNFSDIIFSEHEINYLQQNTKHY